MASGRRYNYSARPQPATDQPAYVLCVAYTHSRLRKSLTLNPFLLLVFLYYMWLCAAQHVSIVHALTAVFRASSFSGGFLSLFFFPR